MQKLIKTDNAKTIILIRLIVGSIFLSEGIQKFLYPVMRGVGRFEKMGLSEMVDEMKKRIIEQTVEVIKKHNNQSDINETYNMLSVMWS